MSVQKARQGYKLVKWLFRKEIEIPEDWNLLKLKQIASVNSEQITENYERDEIKYIDIASIENYQITKYENIKFDERPSRAQRIVRHNDILVSMVRPYLHGFTKVPENDENLICSTGFAIIRSKSMSNADFIFNYVKSHLFEQIFIRQMEGMAYPAITSTVVSESLIPIPNEITERKKIGLILSNVDSLIDQTQKIIDQTIILKKGLMQRLLTRGIGHTKFKKVKWYFGNEIEIPEEWNLIELRDIVTSYKNGIYKPDKFYGSGYPSIRMFNIVDGKIIKENAPFLQVDEQELDDYGLATGDIVINRVNSDYLVGKAGIVTDDLGLATFESKNIRVRIDTRKCIPNFVNMYFSTKDYFNQIRSFIKTAVGQVTINQEDLNHIMIKLPSLKEQQKIASILSNVDSKITDLQSKKFTLQKLKKGLMQKLLTGQIRVTV